MKALRLGLSIGVLIAVLVGCEDDPRDLDYLKDAGATHAGSGGSRPAGSGGSGGSTPAGSGGSGGSGGSTPAGSGGSAGTDDQDAG